MSGTHGTTARRHRFAWIVSALLLLQPLLSAAPSCWLGVCPAAERVCCCGPVEEAPEVEPAHACCAPSAETPAVPEQGSVLDEGDCTCLEGDLGGSDEPQLPDPRVDAGRQLAEELARATSHAWLVPTGAPAPTVDLAGVVPAPPGGSPGPFAARGSVPLHLVQRGLAAHLADLGTALL